MRIFILEDCFEQRKHILLKDMPDNAEIIVASNYHEATKLLVADDYDVYMMDHDLGFDGLNVADETTKHGIDVAKFMRDNGLGKNKLIIFHSTNIVGVKNMCAALQGCGRTMIVASLLQRDIFKSYARIIRAGLDQLEE